MLVGLYFVIAGVTIMLYRYYQYMTIRVVRGEYRGLLGALLLLAPVAMLVYGVVTSIISIDVLFTGCMYAVIYFVLDKVYEEIKKFREKRDKR